MTLHRFSSPAGFQIICFYYLVIRSINLWRHYVAWRERIRISATVLLTTCCEINNHLRSWSHRLWSGIIRQDWQLHALRACRAFIWMHIVVVGLWNQCHVHAWPEKRTLLCPMGFAARFISGAQCMAKKQCTTNWLFAVRFLHAWRTFLPHRLLALCWNR
jgi:hypothetical protein